MDEVVVGSMALGRWIESLAASRDWLVEKTKELHGFWSLPRTAPAGMDEVAYAEGLATFDEVRDDLIRAVYEEAEDLLDTAAWLHDGYGADLEAELPGYYAIAFEAFEACVKPRPNELKRPGGARPRPAAPTRWAAVAADGAANGDRTKTARSYAGHLLWVAGRCNLDDREVLETLRSWNATRCRPSLPEGELASIFKDERARQKARTGA